MIKYYEQKIVRLKSAIEATEIKLGRLHTELKWTQKHLEELKRKTKNEEQKKEV